MNKILIVFCALVLTLVACITLFSADGQEPPVFIRLAGKNFDPLASSAQSLKNSENASLERAVSADGYYILQFEGPVQKSWKQAASQLGVSFFDYVPDFAFIIHAIPGTETKLRTLPHVRWMGVYKPSFRISTNMIGSVAGGNAQKTVKIKIQAFPNEDEQRLEEEIKALSTEILEKSFSKWQLIFVVKTAIENISKLSELAGVKWISPVIKKKALNDKATDIIWDGTQRISSDDFGLYGEGQIIGICDGGLDQGYANADLLHDDFEDGQGNSRVLKIFDLAGNGAEDTDGHGTHVAGSVLGNGQMSGSDPENNDFSDSFAGAAPKAQLIFQAYDGPGGEPVLPNDLNELFAQAQQAGAMLHSNSWGASVSFYTDNAMQVDQYIWDHKDFLILFAAGNSGIDRDKDGVVDLYNLDDMPTAKNCVSVGASESLRTSGGLSLKSWEEVEGDKFDVEPIASDLISDDKDGMAAFSSRGPTLDGRFKPDIVAPGTNIISTRSSKISEANKDNNWGEYNDEYMYDGGTSMSCPLTAGTAALIREYLMTEQGFSLPSAALLKAALLNSAADITPGQYGAGEDQEIPDLPTPNNVAGWGRLDLKPAVASDDNYTVNYFDQRVGLATGEEKEFSIKVLDSDERLKINLVWSDYPGSSLTMGALVNDLDLELTLPDGSQCYADNAAKSKSYFLADFDFTRDEDLSGFSDELGTAARFVPSTYPAVVKAVSFRTHGDVDIDIVIYDEDTQTGLPGEELYRKRLYYVPEDDDDFQLHTVEFNYSTIRSGAVFISLEKNEDNAQQGVYLFENEEASVYLFDGQTWTKESGAAPVIGLTLQEEEMDTNFDRINNVVGMTIDTPQIGDYKIKISGYNIPQGGTQSYAFVVSGNIEKISDFQILTQAWPVSESNDSTDNSSGSSGGGGCVFTSKSGIGGEWLLLFIVLFWLHRRYKL